MSTELPAPFAALAELGDGPLDLEMAKRLSEALKAVPDLQAWLREQRQRTVRALRDQDISKEEIAASLGVTPQRVSDIASGHSRSRVPRRQTSTPPAG